MPPLFARCTARSDTATKNTVVATSAATFRCQPGRQLAAGHGDHLSRYAGKHLHVSLCIPPCETYGSRVNRPTSPYYARYSRSSAEDRTPPLLAAMPMLYPRDPVAWNSYRALSDRYTSTFQQKRSNHRCYRGNAPIDDGLPSRFSIAALSIISLSSRFLFTVSPSNLLSSFDRINRGLVTIRREHARRDRHRADVSKSKNEDRDSLENRVDP